MHVHHIVPVSMGGPTFEMWNCATLCIDCHHKMHAGKPKPPEPWEHPDQVKLNMF